MVLVAAVFLIRYSSLRTMIVLIVAEWNKGFFKQFQQIELTPNAPKRRLSRLHLLQLRDEMYEFEGLPIVDVIGDDDRDTLFPNHPHHHNSRRGICYDFAQHVNAFYDALNPEKSKCYCYH